MRAELITHDEEREVCQQTIRTLNGGSEKVRRAQVLLKADADGPAWTDRQIAEAFSCRTKTENIRQRCVLEGFEQALERKRRESPPVEKLLDGEQESHVIALRLGPPPRGFANWSLRLLARRVSSWGSSSRSAAQSAEVERRIRGSLQFSQVLIVFYSPVWGRAPRSRRGLHASSVPAGAGPAYGRNPGELPSRRSLARTRMPECRRRRREPA